MSCPLPGTFPAKAAFSYCWHTQQQSSCYTEIIFHFARNRTTELKPATFCFLICEHICGEDEKNSHNKEHKHLCQVNFLTLHHLKTTCFLTSLLFYHTLIPGTNKPYYSRTHTHRYTRDLYTDTSLMSLKYSMSGFSSRLIHRKGKILA